MTAYAFTTKELDLLDATSFVPLYIQLAEKISMLVRQQGEQAAGKALPSESECVKHFRLSRPTVRQAMSHLLSQGLIVREKGRGTFVAPPKVSHEISHGFEDEMKAAHRNVQFRLLDWRQIVAPDEVQTAFQWDTSSQSWYLRRLRSVDRIPIGIEERFFPASLGKRLSENDAKSQPMLNLLRKLTGERIAQLKIEVSSIASNKEMAALLRIKTGAPLLVKKLTYVFEGRALAFGTTTFAGDHYQFRFSVNLPI